MPLTLKRSDLFTLPDLCPGRARAFILISRSLHTKYLLPAEQFLLQ
ncbi:hypothetical protein [Silvimonas amylolytica]|nr:hypothetical protein [Silvimonas amylolytica]